MSTSRMEAFSDGVIAVAITVLALGLVVPPPGDHGTPAGALAGALGAQWPSYAAYVVSFSTIGIIWINHHAMVGRLREADHAILGFNLLLLMSIGVLPFTTNLMATYLKESGGAENVGAAVYAGSFLVMGIAFAAMQRHILFAKTHLLALPLPLEQRRKILSRSVAGLLPYVIATVLAALSPYVTLAICAALAAYYATPASRASTRAARDAQTETE